MGRCRPSELSNIPFTSRFEALRLLSISFSAWKRERALEVVMNDGGGGLDAPWVPHLFCCLFSRPLPRLCGALAGGRCRMLRRPWWCEEDEMRNGWEDRLGERNGGASWCKYSGWIRKEPLMQLISAICRVITAHNPYFVPVPVQLLLTLKNSFMHSTLNSVAHRVADPTKVHVLHYLYPHHHNTTTTTTTSTRSSRPFHHAQRARLVL